MRQNLVLASPSVVSWLVCTHVPPGWLDRSDNRQCNREETPQPRQSAVRKEHQQGGDESPSRLDKHSPSLFEVDLFEVSWAHWQRGEPTRLHWSSPPLTQDHGGELTRLTQAVVPLTSQLAPRNGYAAVTDRGVDGWHVGNGFGAGATSRIGGECAVPEWRSAGSGAPG